MLHVLGGIGHDLSNVLLPLRAQALVVEAGEIGASSKGAEGLRSAASRVQRAVDALQALCADSGIQDADLWKWWTRVGATVEKAVPRGVGFIADIPEASVGVRADIRELTWRLISLVHAAGTEVARSEMVGAKAVRIRARVVQAGGSVRLEIWPECDGARVGKPRSLRLETRMAGSPRSARCVVSLGAGRLAALVRFALLSTLGAGSTAVDAAEPGDAQVWVVDGASDTLDPARSWRARTPGGLLVVAGTPDATALERWQGLGAAVLAREDDVEGLRRRVREWMSGGVAGEREAGAQRA